MYSDKALNLVQAWLTGFPAMDHCTTFGMASSSVRTLITPVSVNPSALRHAKPVAHMSRAAQGWEKKNMAVTWVVGNYSRPANTSNAKPSLLPTLPAGVGRMEHILYTA